MSPGAIWKANLIKGAVFTAASGYVTLAPVPVGSKVKRYGCGVH